MPPKNPTSRLSEVSEDELFNYWYNPFNPIHGNNFNIPFVDYESSEEDAEVDPIHGNNFNIPFVDYESSEEDAEVDLEELVRVGVGVGVGVGAEQANQALLKLPLDIFLDIISRLPIKPLAVCRCVCKTWLTIVHHPRFTKMHHTKAITQQPSLLFHVKYGKLRYIEDELSSDIHLLECDNYGVFDNGVAVNPQFDTNIVFELVGSSAGLLCLCEQHYFDPVYICNPVIGEYFELPGIEKRTNFDIISGFGFDKVANEYKVIRMRYDYVKYEAVFVNGSYDFKLEAEIYTLGSGEWRKIGDVPYPLCRELQQTFVNGALHWHTDLGISLSALNFVVAFDVGKEEFRVIQDPPNVNRPYLLDLGGHLCLVDGIFNDRYEIWVMKEYGVYGSWTKEYIISQKVPGFGKTFFRPVMLMMDGNILLASPESLICYDPARKHFIKFRNLKLSSINATTYVGSFISLRDILGFPNSKRSLNKGRWFRTLESIFIQDPEEAIDDWILSHELSQLAYFSNPRMVIP